MTVTGGSWPYLPGQCPDCVYLHPMVPPFVDDSGYEIVGTCWHPRIGMELFRSDRSASADDRCPCFLRWQGSADR
jgi:hypothetical protein